jgi:LmbE family N-acetylglucosaminyl deacetylase
MTQKLTLMAIFAHPDDEAFGMGGTLTRYAREGVDLHLVVATLGEVGELANPDLRSLDQPLGILREHELRCACDNYGVVGLHLLGYIDGQTTVVPQSDAVYKIVRLLRQIRPQVVVSFGPEGIYGHYDHLAVHRWATAAVQFAADTGRWPEAGPAHRVAKFYHRAMPQDQVDRIEEPGGRRSVPIDGIPFPFVGYPLERITTIIDVRDYVATKLRGIRCHASQLNPASPYLQAEFDEPANPWFWQETFILAQYRPELLSTPLPAGKENDLFAGLR